MKKTQTKLFDRDLNILSRRYVLISPCRNEALYIPVTIDSVAAQTILPTKWIVIDDNSTDETPQLLAQAVAKYPFIEVIRRDRSGGRKVGPAVIEAFYEGFQTINPDDYDYICKFDMDLDIPPNYFELLMERMEANPRIGSCSGKPYFRNKQGQLISEKCGDETSVGMTKFYRMKCFQQIGGFVREVMWDGIDCHRCRMYGWIASSWDDPELRFIHLRPMGSSQKGMLTGRMRHGFGQYFMGTGLLYMSLSALYRMSRPPLIIGGLFMLIGYLKSMLLREQRYNDLEFRKFLRRYQWNCLLKGKVRATQELNRCQAKKWMQLQ
jgi:glycosyltransferase involved in cell wall biosynthesis